MVCCPRGLVTHDSSSITCLQVSGRAISDDWLGAEALLAISFKGLILPERHPPHTELLDLDPLPLSALDCPAFEALYRFSHFNPIQTQARRCCVNLPDGQPRHAGQTSCRLHAAGMTCFLSCALLQQAFHTLYHTDENVLLGAPTGSGKTISAELAMLRVFRAHPGMKVIYIAPLKARDRASLSPFLLPRIARPCRLVTCLV